MLTWLRRVLLGGLALLVLLLVTGIVYEQWGRRKAAREFPPPGELVEFDGALSHLDCAGEGSPTVVLEAGLGVAGSRSWSAVQPEVAAATRICSYDRAGFLWSEPREEPRDAERIAGELHGLLEAASESPPYVMVGHSLGGLLVRVYDDRFPGEVAGLVLVDPSHPEQFDRYPREVVEHRSRQEESLPPPLLFRAWTFVGGFRFTRPPPEDAVQAFLWRTVPHGLLGETAARDAIYERAAQTGTLVDRPLVVLSAGVPTRVPGVPDQVLEEWHETRRTLHAELAGLSGDSDLRTVQGADHDIHREKPEAVIAAIRDVVKAVRQGTAVSGEGGTGG